MFDSALTMRGISAKAKVTYHTLVSAALIAMAAVLPQIFHAALGAQGGAAWLPMYLPVLAGGCLLGVKWGLAVGVLSPIVSFLITSAMGNAMPAAARLPFMIVELAVFALVAGAFSKGILRRGRLAYPAVLCAMAAGRSVFLAFGAVFGQGTAVWQQILAGWRGLVLQLVIVPVAILVLRSRLMKDQK